MKVTIKSVDIFIKYHSRLFVFIRGFFLILQEQNPNQYPMLELNE